MDTSEEAFPKIYSEQHTPVTVDVTEITFIGIFIIIAISFAIIIPSYRKKQSINVTIKIGFSLLIGCLLIIENFGQEWEYGCTKSKTPYRAGVGQQIEAEIAVKIGLRSVNITLKAKPEEGTLLAKETINYNERFPWTWDQGIFGFGPYAGLLQRTFREGQKKGLPIPILWIAEYFIIDGEGIRFGRFYRTAGWYCHILLWTAFACWLLANIYLQCVVRYTAYLIGIIGGLQLLTCIVWVFIHNPTPLMIPFEDGTIKMALGLHFWMTFGCGLFCLLLAIMMVYMDLYYSNTLSTFLGIDPFIQHTIYNDAYQSYQMDNKLRKIDVYTATDSMEMRPMPSTSQSKSMKMQMVSKRRSSIKNAQKSLFRTPVKMEVYCNDEVIYENESIAGSISKEKVPMPKVYDENETQPPPIPKKKRIKVSP
ncbi:hypothetical protein HN011_004642 [Eciton burchellii]|nr:hypothetical protein HN011_004642 [Eciton burchellii]